ncbi:gas vesicle protein K [Actinomadura sp. 9N215]|uniref:gas vesicle protein K n=1 Tax=Actinomadura sp. 9N215 TaxID=3375150 RepID=UPI0037B81F7A
MTRPDPPARSAREPVTGEAEVRDAPAAYPFTAAPAPAPASGSGCGEGARERSSRTMARLRSDPETVERDLVKLVLTLVELIRQLMERQALRRADGGDLTGEQVEALGLALMRLDEAMTRLKDHFGLDDHDLNLDLGPLGPLLPDA